MKTVCFIHGLNCTPKIFTHLHSQLPKHNAILIDYASGQPVEDSYEELVYHLPKNTPLSIVGHSLGGILGHLITTRDNDIKVENLISISTPFGGSDTAGMLKWFYPGFKILRDLTPKSRIISEVTGHPVKLVPFTSIISTSGHLPFISDVNDGVVSIRSQESSVADSVVYVASNHFEIMQDPHTIEEVKKTIFRRQ